MPAVAPPVSGKRAAHPAEHAARVSEHIARPAEHAARPGKRAAGYGNSAAGSGPAAHLPYASISFSFVSSLPVSRVEEM